MPSPALVARLSKLILGTTLLAALVFPLVVPAYQFWVHLVAPLFFSMVYLIAWYLAASNRPLAGAWVFIAITWIGQMGVVLTTGALTAQALVSCMNLILATGFMLGKRVVVLVGTVCVASVLSSIMADYLGWLAVSSVQANPEAGFVALGCVVLATAGLTYIGIENLTAALGEADVSARQAKEALVELERARQADSERSRRVERLGTIARDIVGLVEHGKLTQEIAIGLKDALDASVVIVLGRGGRIHASAGLGQREVPTEFFSEEFEQLLSPGGFTVLDQKTTQKFCSRLNIDHFGTLMAARGMQTSVTLLVFGGDEWLAPGDVEWPVQVATNLLESAMIRLESEGRLVQAQKMEALNRLSAGIAHDFNNLLTIILGGAELVGHKAKPNDPIQQHLGRIREAGSRAASLTSKLMTFTRGAPKNREIVELTTLASDLLPVLRRTIEESIHIEYSCDNEEIWVDADPIDVERIILNLVANARDAIGDVGRIDIGVEIRPISDREQNYKQVVLWVQDDGEGMSLDTRIRVFEPFFTTRKGKGATGLGLSIVYGVAQALGGDVYVDSEKGMGTCVEVHLPMVAAPSGPPAERKLVTASVSGARVLVVEDDPDVRDTVCEMLRLGGFVAESVSSGEEALRVLSERDRYRLVVSDVIMPSMSGFELAQAMKTKGFDTPIALISGYARGGDTPGDEHQDIPRITKPFTMSDLLLFVQRHMA